MSVMTTHSLPDLPQLPGDLRSQLMAMADFFESAPELAPSVVSFSRHRCDGDEDSSEQVARVAGRYDRTVHDMQDHDHSWVVVNVPCDGRTDVSFVVHGPAQPRGE